MNEALQVLGQEMVKTNERITMGTNEVEKRIMEKYARQGRTRGTIGFVGSAAVCAGLWRKFGGQRRWLGGLLVSSGGIFGFAYGILSIRRPLFLEMLTLPTDQSPFAARARQIFDARIPTNTFYQEVKARMRDQHVATDSWVESAIPPTFPKLDTTKPYEKETYDAVPSITSYPQSIERAMPPSLPHSTQAQPEEETTRSPFFFDYRKPSYEHDGTDDISRARRGLQVQRPKDTRDGPYNQDEWENSAGKPQQPKPTTWEELRRRAASRPN